jgi:phage shock protein A
MALPKAVQQQLEEADRIVADINGEKTGEDSSETNPVNQQVDQNIQADPPLNDLPPDNTVSQETRQSEIPEEKWAHKYHTLKGMYDAEVPRLHSQMREMQTQMQQLIADKAAVEATKVEQKQVVESLITEQDKEAFGPDLIDLIERATESKVGTLREREAQLVQEIKELKGQLGSVSERQVVSDKDRFLVGLGQQVSDWEALNVDQGFLAWLQQVDPVYGVPRQAALSNAYEVLDVTRVANIFKAYKQTLPQTPAPSRAKQELQRQVAPTRTRSTTTPTDNVNDKIFTNQDIEQFYNDWRRGFYDEQEAADMEKQIHTAIAEGRIR